MPSTCVASQGRGGWLQSRLPASAGRVVQKAPVVLGVPTLPSLPAKAPQKQLPSKPAAKRLSAAGSQKQRSQAGSIKGRSQSGSVKQLPPPRS